MIVFMPHFGHGHSSNGILHTFDKEIKDRNGLYIKDLLNDKVENAKNELERQFQKETMQEIVHNVVDFIPDCHLNREFYPNNPDGSNEEINNLINHSPVDIEKRIAEGKGVFYMNPCIIQTLYTINKLKERFPDLKEHIKLGIEFLEFENNGIQSAHAFIEINVPKGTKMIIDYARSNDVYIYQGDYKNNTVGVVSKMIIPIPAKIFDKSDNVFKIAEKAGFDDKSIYGIENNLNVLLRHLCNENNGNDKCSGEEKYNAWKKQHGDSPIYCMENGKDAEGNTKWLKLKMKSGDDKKFFIENGKNGDGSIVWAELMVENKNPLKIYIINEKGNKEYVESKLDNNIKNLILYCK